MTDDQPKDRSSDLESARELVRGAAKWFVAGLGAIGAVLIAGSQLSSIGSLERGSGRLTVALVGVVVGLLAILWAMWKVVDILAGRRWTLDDLAIEWTASSKTPLIRRWRHPVGRFFRSHPTQLGNYTSISEIKTDWDESEPDREGLDDLRVLIDKLDDEANYVDLTYRFRMLRWHVGAAVAVASAGVIAFAWAANPAHPEQPAPSMRNADLVNADLRGASLRNADLTGANLSGANPRGADLKGATIKDTRWSNTICPDGVNSDDVARSGDAATDQPTCEGHLTP